MFDREMLKEQMLSLIDGGYRMVPLNSIIKWDDGSLHCGCEQARMHAKGYRDADGNAVEDCPRTGKHPTTVGYTKTPAVVTEQRIEIEVDEGGATGYGVLLHFDDYQLIVIDVDNHGGGNEGDKDLSRLCDAYPDLAAALMSCGLVVNTSNGGKHYYFKAPAGVGYISHIDGYKNIDIKVSGFVAGPGSMHRSGAIYIPVDDATLEDITDAPQSLLNMLRAPEIVNQRHNGRTYSASVEMIGEMLSCMKPDMISKYDCVSYESYDAWVHVGMSIHAATDGSTDGLEAWDLWSQDMSGYDFGEIQYKWLTFGRNTQANKSIGYLFDEARHCGWIPPAREGAPTGQSEAYVEVPTDKPADVPNNVEWPSEYAINSLNRRKECDLSSPPGGVCAISEYILKGGFKPRPSLAVAAGIYCAAVAAAFTLKTRDGKPVATNTIMACAAGSGTGKNAVISSVAHLLDFVGMGSATNGEFKSGQAVMRGLVEHQALNYVIDEFGEKIGQVIKAHGGESHSYLAQVIPQIMSIYSQSTERAVVEREMARSADKDVSARLKEIRNAIDGSGMIKEGDSAEATVAEVAHDLHRGRYEKKSPEMHAEWLKELEERGITAEQDEENPPSSRAAWDVADRHVVGCMQNEQASLKRVRAQLRNNHISRPYLSMFGVTTGETFFPCMTPSLIKNGLWGRAMLFIEHDDAPWPSEKIDDAERLALRWNAEDVMSRIAGSCANHFKNVGRVEEMTERETVLEYTEGAQELIDAVRVWESVKAKSRYAQSTGATALYNRAAELTQRLAVVLACGEIPKPEIGKCDDGSPYNRIATVTEEHVRWSYAMIEADTMRKNLLLVAAMDDDHDMIKAVIECRLKVHMPRGEGAAVWRDALTEKISTGAITRKDISLAIDKMIDNGHIAQKVVEPNPFDAAMGADASDNVKIWWVKENNPKKACNESEEDLYLQP